jgi:glycosyltransferase involved in cell wall biosynthesis
MNHTIGILMVVYNECDYIQSTIESVLSQTHQNWTLYISDNHSTDGTSTIIDDIAGRDTRIKKLKPPSQCKASFEHALFIREEALKDEGNLYGIVSIGGHDLISPNYLELLLNAMLQDPACSLTYPLTAYCIDAIGRFQFKYNPMPQTFSHEDPFQSLSMLLSLSYNIPSFGLLRYSIWKQVPIRHQCTGVDHFLIAEYGLKGRIKGVEQAVLQARNPTNNYIEYQAKHFGGKLDPCKDMLRQLDWLHHLCVQAFSNQTDIEKNCMFASTAAMYILKFLWIFNNEPEAKQEFLAMAEISNLIGGQAQLGSALSELLTDASLETCNNHSTASHRP